MIKKFEEFVNEMYSSRANIDYGKELVKFLDDESKATWDACLEKLN